MARLLVLVEGETEETFVNEVLAPHLYQQGLTGVSAKLMGNARQRNRRGGIRGWPSIGEEIVRHLTTDRSLYVALMVDYYALPSEGDRAWPGRFQASYQPLPDKATHIVAALQQTIRDAVAAEAERFLPYIMMHEFEGLLFSDCRKFAESIGRVDVLDELQKIRDRFPSPEAINDSPETHPSQRIKDLIPEYQKPLYGNIAAIEIGLDTLARECFGFRDWLQKLTALH